MGFKVIEHEGAILHFKQVTGIDKEQFLIDINDYLDFMRPGQTTNKYTNPKSGIPVKGNGPGVQLTLNFLRNSKPLIALEEIVSNYIEGIVNNSSGRKIKNTYSSCWIYKSHSDNNASNFHEHHRFSPYEDIITTSFTWVYYLQMPDNLNGDEGKILFSKTESESTALKVLPQEGDLIIFPSNLPHMPNTNPNSTKSRITIAGNLAVNYKNSVLI